MMSMVYSRWRNMASLHHRYQVTTTRRGHGRRRGGRQPAQLAKVLKILEGIQREFNSAAAGGKEVSLADLISEAANTDERMSALRAQLAHFAVEWDAAGYANGHLLRRWLDERVPVE